MFLNHNLIAYFVLYVQRLPTSLKILTNEEMKDFLFIYFHKYFKSKRKKMYFEVKKYTWVNWKNARSKNYDVINF